MGNELFRQEVIDARRGDWLGTVHVGLPRLQWVMAVIAACFALAMALALSFGRYTRSEHVQGQLVPSGGLLAIAAPASGVVTRVLVDEGQAVTEGQPLLEISSERSSVRLGSTGTAISAELELQRARLEADLLDDEQLARSRRDTLSENLIKLREQLAVVDAQRAIRQQQVDSANRLLQRVAPLRERGVLSLLQFQQYEAAALEAEAQLKLVLLQRVDAEKQLGAATQELDQLPLKNNSRRRETERKLADLSQALARNEAERAEVVRAPRAAVTSGLTVFGGQTIAQGERLLSLIPQHSVLQAELWVPSRAIGLLAAGDRVAMRYHAFPFQKFGRHFGSVREIAGSALAPEEVLRLTGLQVNEPSYRVLVALDQQAIPLPGGSAALRATMSLDADLLFERRRLYEWVLQPLQGRISLGERAPASERKADPS